jgi:hypothetical protein
MGLAVASAVAVVAATTASLWWILTTRTNSLSEEAEYQFDDPWVNSLGKVVLWIFQSIAAFPTRAEQAPTVVYGLVLAALIAVFIGLGRWSERRWRLTFLAMIAVWLVPPYIFTGLTYVDSGAIWQGRYSLPYSIGIPLVLLAWGASGQREPRTVLIRGLTGICYAAAAAVSIANVRRAELVSSPLADDARWITTPEPAIIAFAFGGTLLMFAASTWRWERSDRTPSRRTLEAQSVLAK